MSVRGRAVARCAEKIARITVALDLVGIVVQQGKSLAAAGKDLLWSARRSSKGKRQEVAILRYLRRLCWCRYQHRKTVRA